MSNVFNIKRFWKYFCFELKNVADRYGISLIIFTIMPVIVYLFAGSIGVIFTESHMWHVDATSCAASAISIALVSLIVSFPPKMYGNLTAKQAGSTWTMMPVTALEKLLSMLTISLVLVPGVVLLGNVLFNEVITLFDHSYTNELSILFSKSLFEGTPMTVNICPFFSIWLETAELMIFFLLGALVFKKAKAGKSFLSLLLLMILFILIIFLIFGSFDEDRIEDMMFSVNEETAVIILNAIVNVALFLWFAGLGTALFFRIKRIKY